MDQINYRTLNFENSQEMRRTAEIHESAPLNWDPTYIVHEENIQKRYNRLKKAASDKNIYVILAKTSQDEIIGLHWIELSEKQNEKCAQIISLWVSEKYRKNNIGKHLKKIGEEWAKKHGAKFMVTNVFYSNKRMIEYNLKLGFAARTVEMIKDL